MGENNKKISNTLFISGTALIAFGILDIVQFIVYWFIDPMQGVIIDSLFNQDKALGISVVSTVIAVLVIEVFFAFFVGLSARAEAKGKKKNIAYVVVAIIFMALLIMISLATVVYTFFNEITIGSIIDAVMSVILATTVSFAVVDIVVSSIKNRKMRKKEKEIDTLSEEQEKGTKEAKQ